MTKVKERIDRVNNWIEKVSGFKGYVKYIWNADLMITSLKPLVKIPNTITINNKERFVLVKPAETLFGKPVFWLLKGYPLSITMNMVQTTKPIVLLENDKISQKTVDIIETISVDKHETLSKKIQDKKDDYNVDIIEPNKLESWKVEFEQTYKKRAMTNKKTYTKAFSFFLKEKMMNQQDKSLDFGFSKDEINAIVLEKVVLPEFHTSQDFQTFTQSGYTETVLSKKAITVNQVLIYILTIIVSVLTTYTITNSIFQATLEGLK